MLVEYIQKSTKIYKSTFKNKHTEFTNSTVKTFVFSQTSVITPQSDNAWWMRKQICNPSAISAKQSLEF